MIIPMFAEFEVSPYCVAQCELAMYETECVCASCGGANHGRCSFPVYMDRQNGFVRTMYSNGEERHWYQKGPLTWFWAVSQ